MFERLESRQLFSAATAIAAEYAATAQETDVNGTSVQSLLGTAITAVVLDRGDSSASLQIYHDHGVIYYSPATGAHVVFGSIGAEYAQLAAETDAFGNNAQDVIGLPTSDEMNISGYAGARTNTFQDGSIDWSSSTGAHAVLGAIAVLYNKTGGPTSWLGLPISDESGPQSDRVVDFTDGSVSWNISGGAVSHPRSATTLAVFHGSNGTSNTDLEDGSVIEVDNVLYGTTSYGGAHNDGTVYEYSLSNQKLTTLYSFSGGSSNGANPDSDLLDVNGVLYGDTAAGGIGNDGTLFCYDISTAKVKTDVLFDGSNGKLPGSGLLAIGNDIYGTTAGGGSGGGGTVFKYVIGGSETAVVSFSGGADGGSPDGNLVEYDGLLYGTTLEGGVGYLGTIFSYNPANNAFATEYAFSGNFYDSFTAGGLVLLNNMLYGTTNDTAGLGGTVFSFAPSSGAFSTVVSFHGSNGSGPNPTMVAYGGCLYGTTTGGGGTVFCYNPALNPSKGESAIVSFPLNADITPSGNLSIINNNLYGTTSPGYFAGNGTDGTLFEVTGLV